MLLIAGGVGVACAQQIPTIVIDPVPQRLIAGHPLRLIASAAPLSATIQWHRDGIPIPGATGSVLEIENATAVNEGFYKAVASLPGGSCWSREVFVTVDTPLPSPGVLDFEFHTPGMEGSSVDVILPLPDGRIAIGGNFQIGKRIRNLAVLGAEGRPDPDFSPGAYPNGRVLALTLSQGRLVAGGNFDRVNGRDCGGIAVFDLSSGELSADWDHTLGFTPDGAASRLFALAADAGGRVIVGGTFKKWRTLGGGEVDRPRLIRLDPNGVPDAGFAISPVGAGQVRSVAVLPGGGLAIGGSFSAPTPNLAVLTEDGSPLPGFALSQIPDAEILAVLPLPDGSYLVGGDFDNVGVRLAHYLADGSLDPAFAVSANSEVNALRFDAEGNVIVGGDFSLINGIPTRRLTRLKPDLGWDDSLRTHGLDDEVDSLAVVGDRIYAGGKFDGPHPLLVRLLADGDAPENEIELVRSPLARETPAGSALDLKVAVSPVRSGQQYLWTKDGEAIVGVAAPSLSLDRVAPDQAGTYQVQIMDETGTATSQPVRVKVTPPMPGREDEFRYRGSPAVIGPVSVASASVSVPDAFSIRNVRVNMDLLHPDTSELEIRLVSPAGARVKLFDDNGLRGRDLRHTTFDDRAGGDQSINQAQPPFTGTFEPDKPLAEFAGTNSAGIWRLELENQAAGSATLLDWSLELRAAAVPVSYAAFLQLRGAADSEENRAAYAIPRAIAASASASLPVPSGTGAFGFVHWRWSAALDVDYSYQRNAPAGWQVVAPDQVQVTRFPGGVERWEVQFLTTKPRRYFRVYAGFGG